MVFKGNSLAGLLPRYHGTRVRWRAMVFKG